jgi:dCMP deaminase
MGYNGFPRGVSDAKEIYDNRDEKYRRIIHAETNAILFAHHDIEGCSIYLTHQPCSQCAAKIIQSGIIRVIFPYSNDDFNRRWQNDIASAYEMFAEAKVEINFFGSSR